MLGPFQYVTPIYGCNAWYNTLQILQTGDYYQLVRGHKSWLGATNGPRGHIWPFLVDSATCLLIISANHMSTSLLHRAQIAAQRCNVKFLAVARGLAAGPNWQVWWLKGHSEYRCTSWTPYHAFCKTRLQILGSMADTYTPGLQILQ